MSGTVFIEGQDVAQDPQKARGLLGVQSDMTGVYPRLTSREQLRYYGGFYGLKGKALEARVSDVIKLLDMDGWMICQQTMRRRL
jgi:sodium transport system ATP-binding protein